MLLIDSRVGSRDLTELLPASIPYDVTYLDSGDVAFLGNGNNSELWPIGVEVKTINDALDSMQTGRFTGGQLPKLLKNYRRSYLLVEGFWTLNDEGCIQLGKVSSYNGVYKWTPHTDTRIRYSSFDNWLTTVSETGIRIKRSFDRKETAVQIANLYNRWQKPFDQHSAILPYYEERWKVEETGQNDSVVLREPSFEELVAKQFPGIGKTKAQAIAAHFGSVKRMVLATEEQWLAIPGIGKKTVSEILKRLEGSTTHSS